MRRGELYRVFRGNPNDSKEFRVFVVVSRQALIESRFLTVVCAPVYSRHDGLSTQVSVGVEEGLKAVSSVHCDELVSIEKRRMSHYVGALREEKLAALDRSLRIALSVEGAD